MHVVGLNVDVEYRLSGGKSSRKVGLPYRLEPKRGDKALTQAVTDTLTGQLIGYVFQPDGKGVGYCWRLPWQKHMSKNKHRYARQAVEEMMEFINSPEQIARRIARQDRINRDR